jgi:shikimate dehydrogenase
MRRCAVLGDPIAHSLSPILHRAAYAELGLPWEYDAHRVPAGGLAAFVGACDERWRGLSLTMPLKREALDVADAVSDRAAAAGAANTLVLESDRILADNTDVPGGVNAICERSQRTIRHADILGGGATAGSMLLALADLGCRSFTLHVRDPERAAETVAVAHRFPTPLDLVVASLDTPAVGDIVVSTIPASAQTPQLLALCSQAPLLFDVTYHPWPTPLALAAANDGRTVISGLDLLIHQAALQFTIFTGLLAPLEVMRAAGEAARSDAAPVN